MLARLKTANSALGAMALLVLISSSSDTTAQSQQKPIDPHRVYEQGCGKCHHEHGADLARLKLVLKDGKLRVARTGKDVAGLLRSHYGVRLTVQESAALFSLFEAGMASGGVYQRRCARCHEQAVVFARSKLTVRDGRIWTRTDDRDVATFLKKHGEATPEEIDILIAMFRRQLETQEK
jgi:cytochrome c5